MSKYFPLYNNSRKNIKVEFDLSNYVTKDDKIDILKLKNRINEKEKEASFSRGFFIIEMKVILFTNVGKMHLIMVIYT